MAVAGCCCRNREPPFSRFVTTKSLLWITLIVVLCSVVHVKSESLTPPYFNLAEGRTITATATCGEDTQGPELYCKLVGANADNNANINVIQGQVCDVCDPNDPKKMHPAKFAIDGTETWWQSPPLSRGMKYNEVSLTIDFGQEFHVAYVYIKMGNSPRPGLWILEKSTDYGKTFTPWQYFSDSAADCEKYFGKESLQKITRDDSVICSTEFSKIVPLESGEIPISLLNNRPSANMYFNSTVLQEWTRATNVRLHFLRTKNLLGHLMSVSRQDPTVTRRYFYSIKDISIGGRCMCNGHADTCDPDPKGTNELICNCRHHTCGSQCAECCPGYEQKAWRQSTGIQKFECERCNCFNHATSCIYDPEIDRKGLSLDIHGRFEGGGVCQDCRDNTEGINCNRCKPRFFRPNNKHWNETDVCQPCECDNFFSTGNCAEGTGQCECKPEFTSPNCDSCSYGYFGYPNCRPCECHLKGTRGDHCEADGGQCPCKNNYSGTFCNSCAEEFYDFPECLPCECNTIGSLSNSCNQETGNCSCRSNFGGRTCDQCEHGYYNYPSCTFCNCEFSGTEAGICDKETGQCLCKKGYGGDRCDQCLPGYFGYPDCKPCNCSKEGSASSVCDTTGKCPCLINFASQTCEQCSPGYYKYPECLPCNCDSHGADGVSCDNEGRCLCHNNFEGNHCDQCKEGFYNFPICEECNCHPAGVVQTFAGCGSVPAGELCQCKERVQGRICNECRPLYWNLSPSNQEGCEDCDCHIPGTMGAIGVCERETGQCICKPSVTSRTCAECIDGTYKLESENLFGCTDCGCDIGGSVHGVCNKETGQCTCHPRINGSTCNQPIQTHYFPTLYQFQYEVEDGYTVEYTPVRYAYDEDIFPGYSWKGYAIFSSLQNQVIQDVIIQKPTLYRMILRYVNRKSDPIIGTIVITPDNPSDVEQKFEVLFKPTTVPSFVTVSGPQGAAPSALVMNPGRWSVSIISKQSIFIDYFVLLPSAYYEATILTEKVEAPCTIGNRGLCRHYNYPNISGFAVVHGEGGFISEDDARITIREYLENPKQLNELKENQIPLINQHQPEIHLDLTVSKPGNYILIVVYATPDDDRRTHPLTIESSNQNNRESGRIVLYSCPYTTLCRQVVTDFNHRVAVFKYDSNFVSLILKGDDTTNIGIKSVVAIPYDEWSLDYIQPKSVCVRKDRQCVEATYPIAPDAKKVQFEFGNEEDIAKIRPPNIYDNSSELIYLNRETAMIDVEGKVPQAGYYVFVVHFYQPDHPAFDIDVIVQNGQFYEAKLPIPHCPSNLGCRSVVKQADGNNVFQLTENFVFTIKGHDNKGVWFDYLLVQPADLYSEKILHEEKFDQTREFISKCGGEHYFINTTDEGFCRDSVFSLTTGYNNGALYCNCDYDGSLSFECEQFGGQCQCKPNIIGRKCEACKNGFFGFPNCKPCNCPKTAFCEPETGKCVCPRRVIGPNCDQCKEFTYGYDPLGGCEECKCNPLGVINNDLQCDLLNGSCPCKPNIIGRTCDRCSAGYFSFPYCEECECDLRGTTDEICDVQSAECFCKENVYGPACDICNDGAFNLDESNPEGCSKCFCFGKTTRCSTSDYYRSEIRDMDNWGLVAVVSNETDTNIEIDALEGTPEKLNETSIGADLTTEEAHDLLVYFSAPPSYLGNKLTAYGGNLTYTIFYTTGPFGSAVGGADVILQDSNTYLLHRSLEQPAATLDFTKSLPLVEQNFVLPNGARATRENIMVVLQDLQGIFIRAKYWENSVTTRLLSVSFEVATPKYTYNSILATSVEQCQCPPNYQGLSCEECAPGYYRIETGPHGGYCVPCQCNGHADECDVNTGICFDCKHNTAGDHCEMCKEGFHGDATSGTPMDCLICACPLPVASNNFATSCDVSPDGNSIHCECKDGYAGARCESCSAGFFGKPQVQGEYCKSCECSGNIDPNDAGSCDSVTGDCLRCLNNTFGQSCNLCAPGYFGNAIQKTCQSCDCDKLGTAQCDSYTGICQCHPNVIGEKCDRCEIDHYGFESGSGCLPCECGNASLSKQCAEPTGQCSCQPGVTGRKCDRCQAGYWNYTKDGCLSCGCQSGYSVGVGCNAKTGQCECLPGVIGEKCDHCPYRNVLLPEEGCRECDTCVHGLLDVTDQMRIDLDPVILEFSSTASGYFTAQRLTYINKTVDELIPEVNLLDPNRVDFKIIEQDLDKLDQDTKNLKRRADYAVENSNISIPESNEVRTYAKDVLGSIQTAYNNALKTVADVADIAQRLESGDGIKSEYAIREAEELLEAIGKTNFTEYADAAEKQLGKAQELVDEMEEFSLPIDNQVKTLDELDENIRDFDSRLDNLTRYSHLVQQKADEVEKLNTENRQSKVTAKVETAELRNKEIDKDLEHSTNLLKNASKLLEDAKNLYITLGRSQLDLIRVKNDLNETVIKYGGDSENLRSELDEAQIHASVLAERAEELDNLLSGTRVTADDAIDAANAYKNIVTAIEEADKTAAEASEAGTNATEIISGLGDRTSLSETTSAELLSEARDALNKVQTELAPELAKTKEAVNEVEALNDASKRGVNKIDSLIERIESKPLDDIAKEAVTKSDTAENVVRETTNLLDNINDDLPTQVTNAKQLPKIVDDTRKEIDATNEQLNKISNVIPDISKLINQVQPEQNDALNDVVDIDNKIKKLNQLISEARDEANRINVGVHFYRNTTLELRNPPNLSSLGTSTKVSAYFHTANPNGFLMYLGNEIGTKLRRTKSDDFMALEIENGYPVLTIDLGNGPEKILSSKYVADDTWYQVIVERTGKNVKLTIREEVGPNEEKTHVTEGTLQGTNSIFNLDQDQSRLFIGGYPPTFNIQLANRDSAFEGEIEEVVIGEQPVSLWNFVDGAGNTNGARARDKLVNFTPSTGFRFGGKGYVILDARNLINTRRLTISLDFKTKAEDGLLFLIGQDESFLSLELRGGHVVYQYKIGNNLVATIRSPEPKNDDKWHSIEAGRLDLDGQLRLDGAQYRVRASGSDKELIVSDVMYFGGYPETHNFPDVTNIDFDGCIDNVLIESTPIDLSFNLNAYDVLPGCPDKFAGIVSFSDTTPGYLLYPNATTGLHFEITLTLKTLQSDGLIFYTTNALQNDTLSLSLVNGNLVLKNKDTAVSTSSVKFNDGERHVVSAMHDPDSLQLLVNDYDHFKQMQNLPSRKFTYKNIYFGGLPTNLNVPEKVVASRVPFAGCIEDVTLNGVIVNFAQSSEISAVTLGTCSAIADLPTTAVRFDTDRNREPPIDGEEVTERVDEPVTAVDAKENEIDTDKDPDSEESTKIKEPESTPPGHCALPLRPQSDIGYDQGYQFGTSAFSRVEYDEFPGRHKNKFEFSLEFKTLEFDGILFYAADNFHSHYVSLFLYNGKINFKFNSGAGPTQLVSEREWNDGKWHTVEFSRHNTDAKVLVDGELAASGSASGSTKSLNVNPPYFVGGTEQQISNEVLTNLGINRTFIGCVRNFKHNNRLVGEPRKIVGVIPCSDYTESGVFFNADGGYIKVNDKFKVGTTMEILLDIKPRHHTGVILSVHSRRDYLVLHMKDGVISLVVNNGKGPFEASFIPNSKHYICNGEWHSIQALKSKNVATLAVNSLFSKPARGVSTSTDTKNGLFLGGHPHIARLKGFTVREPFIGCVKNLKINNQTIVLNEKPTFGNVTLNVCPTN